MQKATPPFPGEYRVQRLEFFPAAIASRTADIGRNDRESLPVQAKARDQFSRKQRGGFEFWSDPDVSRGTAGLQARRWRKEDSNPRSHYVLTRD